MMDEEGLLRPSDEGVRLPLWRVLRAQWAHVPLFCVRVALFGLMQLFMDAMRRGEAPVALRATPMDDSLSIAAACWLLVGCTWAALGLLHAFLVWCRTPLRQSRMGRIAWQYVCAHPLLEAMGLVDAPPWTLWLHMHAAGVAVFVLSYGLSGLFWLPQQALLLAATASFMRAHPPVALRRSRWLGALGVLCALLLVGAEDVARACDAATMMETLGSGHAWLWGALAPMSLVWLFFFGADETKKESLRHPDALVSFSLPSLLLIGLVYFCSAARCPNGGGAVMMVVRATTHNNNATAATTSSTLDTMLASDPIVMEALNATRQYYEAIAPAWWWRVVPDSVGGVLATLMAPTLLWLCVVIVLRALARASLGSTLSAYALSAALRKASSAQSVPVGLAIALLCATTPLLLLPELRALEEARLRAALPVVFVETNVRLPLDVYAYVSTPPEEAEEETHTRVTLDADAR